MIWNLLSRYRPKFTRQLSIEPYTADLACRQARLIVEIDGSQHAELATDEARTRFLEAEGWTVIRFWNSEVDENADGVAEAILLKAAECLGGTHPQPLPSREGRPRRPRFGGGA
jgi:very-short-patch-repair endonuclease